MVSNQRSSATVVVSQQALQRQQEAEARRAFLDAQMRLAGITAEQASVYQRGLSERLHQAVLPVGYIWNQPAPGSTMNFQGMTPATTENRPLRVLRALVGAPNSPRSRAGVEKEDAWALYLGLPQRGNSFGVSQYRPAISSEYKTYLKLNNFLSNYATQRAMLMGRPFAEKDVIKEVSDWIDRYGNDPEFGSTQGGVGGIHGTMGTFQWTKGRDEHGHYISYYDKWDLHKFFNPFEGIIGKPFEIYDRIYYDPETFEPINPK